MEKEEQLSQRAYAKLIGCSDGAIRKAIAAGKFSYGYDADQKKIDPVEAKKNPWVQEQLGVKAKPGVSRDKAIKKLAAKVATSDDDEEDEDSVPDIAEMDMDSLLASIKISTTMSASRAMRLREVVQLALEKNKLATQAGMLVEKEKVDKALFAMGSELKKALLNIPQKVVRDIMLAANEITGINILTTAINDVLMEYASFNKNQEMTQNDD